MTFEQTHLSLSYSLTLSFGNFHEINRRKSLNWTKEIGKFPTDIFKIVIIFSERQTGCSAFAESDDWEYSCFCEPLKN